MTIADKLIEIADNTPKVYEAGKAEGIEQGRKSVEESVGERLDDIIEVQNGIFESESPPEIIPDYVSEGLEYEFETLSYSVIGRGSCLDSVIVIPETFDDGVHGELPVRRITGVGDNEEDGAFANDQTIEEIVLPESGAYIDWHAFKGSSLKSVRNYFGGASFWSTGLALEYVLFIDGVGIDSYDFWEVNRALTLDFSRHTAVPELTDTEYLAIHPDLKILVPLELYDEWIVATNWAEYAEYIFPVCVLSDDNEAKFDAVKNGVGEVYDKGYDKGYAEAEDITKGIIEQTLTEIVIPDGVKKIGRSAFFCYYDLKKVTIPEGVEIIQSGAFGWTSITELTLPLSCHTLEESALSSMYQAKKIKLGNVKSIGSRGLAQQDACVEYDFTACDSVPTLASADVFDYDKLNKNNPKMLVPADLYAEWIAATNWAEYAEYIVPYPYVVESGLISFTVDGTSYQAEDGMTWEEWASSDYNTSDAFTPYQGYIVKSSSMFYHISLDGTNAVLGTDYVQASEYTTIYVSGAGGI